MWLGLADQSDRAVFFARKTETKTLTRLIGVFRGVLLYGESGAGKSSVLNAIGEALGIRKTTVRNAFHARGLPTARKVGCIARMASGQTANGRTSSGHTATG